MPIPGTRNPQRLLENLGAADIELAAGEVRKLAAALADIEIAGDRYPARLAKQTGNEPRGAARPFGHFNYAMIQDK